MSSLKFLSVESQVVLMNAKTREELKVINLHVLVSME